MLRHIASLLGILAVASAAYVHAARGPASNAVRPGAATAQTAATAAGAAPALPPSTTVRPVLDKYCVGCHNERRKAQFANLALDSLNVEHVGDHAETWERVVLKLRAGTMPPGGAARPDRATYEAVVASLEGALDRAAAASPNPGRPVIHRLNRQEYVNAVRDLLALDIDGPSLLPADNSGFGFDNIGDVLSVSPALLDRYMSAARKIARLAVGDSGLRPDSTIYKVPTLLVQEDRRNDDLPFGTRGGLLIKHTFPLDGEYIVRIDLRKDYGDQWQGRHEDNHIDLRVDGVRLHTFVVPKSKRQLSIMAMGDEAPNDGPFEYHVAVKAGTHAVSATLLKRTLMTEGFGPERLPVASTSYNQLNGTSETSGRIEMGVQSLEIVGPFNATAPLATESRKRIFVCQPASRATEEGCAKTTLARLARLAYRRTATAAEVQTLMGFFKEGRADGGFEGGIESALERILIAPAFLFRAEHDVKGGANGVESVSGVDLASRLSFFLWSSLPDEELLNVAESGKLREPAVLEQQVKRMMADPRAKSWVSNFFGQWLMLRNVQSHLPDYLEYPAFDDSLREAFARETELFLESQVQEDHSALDLLTADYTFVNERLAEHYGIPNVYGSHFRRVQLTDGKRAGLLGQGSVLLVTAYPNRTSPVVRGKWLLENILGTPPPMPPKNVPPFPENDGKGAPKSVRARMEMHRKNPVCASCHFQLDPLGFALENFDGIGEWRDTDANSPVDASGQFPNGVTFKNASDFRQKLLSEYKSEFVSTLTKKLATYALGRGVEYYDMPAIRTIVRDAAASDYRWSALVMGIVKSMPFQMRRIES